MSGRLIILPKKSWNVWNPENIARVRRDEAAAAEVAAEEQEIEEREAMARNVAKMKRRAAGEPEPEEPEAPREPRDAPAPAPEARGGRDKKATKRKRPDAPDVDARGHVNFFAREERAAAAELGGKTAEEHAEDEAKDAREKRKLGFFAAPVALKAPEGPWYAGAPDLSAVDAGAEASGAPRLGDRKARDGTTRQDRDDARRRAADPMRGLVAIPRRGADAAAPPALPPPPAAPSSSDSDSSDDRRRRRRRKEKKEKKAKKRKRKDQDRGAFAELRRQRLEREATERRRAARVLALHDSGGDVF